jgi:hypothetical protein
MTSSWIARDGAIILPSSMVCDTATLTASMALTDNNAVVIVFVQL